MIRYDWNVMRKCPETDLILIINALTRSKELKSFPSRVIYPISQFQDLSAFLLKPEKLILEHKRHTSSEIFLYLELAAYRSYITYKETGSARLPTDYIREIYELKQLKFNTALDVTNEEIIFIYEEN